MTPHKVCKRGHPFTPDNTRHNRSDGRLHRICRTCERAGQRAWRKLKRVRERTNMLQRLRRAQKAERKPDGPTKFRVAIAALHDAIRDGLAKGFTYREIAKRIGRHHSQVTWHVNKLGLAHRARGGRLGFRGVRRSVPIRGCDDSAGVSGAGCLAIAERASGALEDA